jgi:glycosyltransferase involved in cell wall biosynthesis
MLAAAALGFSRRKKLLFWKLLQGPAIQHAACFHATSEPEYEDIRRFGIRNPVAIVANGIDLPLSTTRRTNEADRVVVALGRLHPIKGLDRLLHAWGMHETQYPDWRLRIVGPAEGGYDAELRSLVAELGLKRVSIEPPLYGQEKYSALEQAELSVLASSNESFGIAAAESLAVGTPGDFDERSSLEWIRDGALRLVDQSRDRTDGRGPATGYVPYPRRLADHGGPRPGLDDA